MRAFVLLVCLAVGCLAQRPQPCRSPSLLSGQLSMSTQSEKLLAFAKYTYDADRERIHLRECGRYHNKSFHFDVLLLFKESVMYKINYKNHTCCKKPLNSDFHPLAIPKNATLLEQLVLGSSSRQGEGVIVNSWYGELQVKKGTAKYLCTVTDSECVPISTLYHVNGGWLVTSFFNNIIGLADPAALIPPSFCKDAQLEKEDEEDPVTFFSLF